MTKWKLSEKIKNKDKISPHLLYLLETDSVWENTGFRERKWDFSLDFPAFGLSIPFEPRNKAILRSKGYAWTLILWSYDNSKKYGSFPTWFILWLRDILMDGNFLRPRWSCFRSQNL